MDRESYTGINSRTIDSWVKDGWEWGIPVSAGTFQRAKEGDWEIFLSPAKPVPRDWFPPIRGRRVLGLAAGGQRPQYLVTLAYKPRSGLWD